MIKVNYTTYSSTYNIRKHIPTLFREHSVIAFDTETRSLYDKTTRNDAKSYLKHVDSSDPYYKQAMLVSNTSGLSFPSIIRTTHFVFGVAKNYSHIVICDNVQKEVDMWNYLCSYEGLLLVHNSLFDLKIMYERCRKLPYRFVDTQILAKCHINNANNYFSKVGLKELMETYYDPKWALMKDYEPETLHEKQFLDYAAIDGAATFYLYELLKEER